MTAAIPNLEPSQLRAGDTWSWTRSLADYSAADGWALSYYFKHSTAAGFKVDASSSGTDHVVTVSATTTAGKTAGLWTWIAQVVKGAEKYTVDQGSVEILADYTASATSVLDDRSHARKTLAAIEAWIESKDTGVAEYEIAGRRMKYIPMADLIKLHNRYKAMVASENNTDRIRKGLGVGGRIQFRT